MSAAQSMTALAESARETERAESSFVTAIPPSPAVSELASCASSVIEFEGRVFRRLQRFHLLPSELKMQSDMVAAYLLTPKVRQQVFDQRVHWWQHPFHLAKAGHGTFVQGRSLFKATLKYLLLSQAANNSLRDAQQLAETLVLSGFLSPAHEAQDAEDEPLEELYVLDDSYYELVAPGAAAILQTPNMIVSARVDSNSTTSLPGTIVSPVQPQQSPTNRKKAPRHSKPRLSVWAVTDGATRAAFMLHVGRSGRFHLRNLFGSKGRRCYAVVNKTKLHSLVLFETDVARREIASVDLTAATVAYEVRKVDDAQKFALKIRTTRDEDTVEILALESKAEQEQWLLALLDAGAAYVEIHPAILSLAASSASLYSLTDTDASGKTFCLSELRGHVALLTNVTSDSCNADAEQLQELADLSTTYKDAGLVVVAFPSAQFGDAEFDTDEELVEHFQELFGVRFPVMTTRDVNGPNARDAMLFCKTRLPGSAHSAANAFIENNFVKFLVGRDGHLFKRYGPRDLPLSMETDIQGLLKARST
ncbi:hypothetical protein V7S43_012605 [Phytophthora oleae]|uniref:PH domain-containing protein n=1 Tax=Phytophthora oleae TaxID=2107226 RepID=A0ABD3F748_9STRA